MSALAASKSRTPGLGPLMSGVILRAQSDARLVALARAGNEQAFTVIFERYEGELAAHAGRIVRRDRAGDIVQHSMLRAWLVIESATEIVELRAMLHRIVHNAALDMVAKRGYDDAEISRAASAPDTAELAERRLSARTALAAVAGLPEDQRRALVLSAVEGRSGRDVAVAMGTSEGAARQLVRRARTRLRSAVSAVMPLPLLSWTLGATSEIAAAPTVGAGLGAGLVATVAKVGLAVGVGAATLGAGAHLVQRNDDRGDRPGAHRAGAKQRATAGAVFEAPDAGRGSAVWTASAAASPAAPHPTSPATPRHRDGSRSGDVNGAERGAERHGQHDDAAARGRGRHDSRSAPETAGQQESRDTHGAHSAQTDDSFAQTPRRRHDGASGAKRRHSSHRGSKAPPAGDRRRPIADGGDGDGAQARSSYSA